MTVIALVLMPALVGNTSASSNLAVALGITALKVATLLVFTVASAAG